MYMGSIAKRIILVSLQLNKPIFGPLIGAAVWAPVQDKVAGIGIFVIPNVYWVHCKKNYPFLSSAE